MTTTAYLGRCVRCGPAVRLDYVEASRMFRACNGAVRCVTCKRELQWDAIEGRVTAGVCDARCWDAIRGSCRCSCGGVKHAITFGVFERAS